ncbi:hypothetical protein OAS39_07420 [Pirellulales bacterium]|nr:hypothetical protein [Pirellulales bacterium]
MSTGRHLDVSSDDDDRASGGREPRRFLGVHFACCGAYARVYANQAGTQYAGNCPRCGGRVTFAIGPGGSDRRFFTAG